MEEPNGFRMTVDELKDLVRDEVLKYLGEKEELLKDANIYRDPDTGHFSDKKTGNIKSLSVAAGKRLNIDPKYHGKGFVASDPDKTRTVYGMADCGRTDVQTGKPQKKKKRCRDGKPYNENMSSQRKREIAKCRQMGMRFANEVIEDFLKRHDMLARSSKGELYKKGK